MNRRSLTGLIASRKNSRMVASESSLERDFMLLLDFDRDVDRYEEQPVKIEYRDAKGSKRTYTPDVLVYYRQDISPEKLNSPLLCEVKYRKDLFENWKDNKPKIRAGRAYAREQGWRFQIFTEREIRTPYLENARFLRQYLRIDPDTNNRNLLLETIRQLYETDPDSLLLAIHQDRLKRAELLPTLWHLLAVGMIEADLTQPLNMRSSIRPTVEESQETLIV
jgi:hypothetical protein